MKKTLHFYKSCGLKSLKRVFVMILLLMSANLALASSFFSAQLKSFNIKNATVKEAIKQVLKDSKYSLIYSVPDMEMEQKITIVLSNVTEEEALKKIMSNTGLTYFVKDNNIVISKSLEVAQQPQQKITISGKIIDDSKKPIAGATILVVGTTEGAISDEKGAFTITMKLNSEVEISFVGMVTVKRKFTASEQNVIITMKNDAMAVEDVVVTGIYTRPKESFTGSAAVYTNKDLKMVGNMNILQSLKSLDPAFAIIENNQFGSDPNRLPDIEIRGKTSVLGLTSEYDTDPNQPLFILDGFETTLQKISDLSMDRVQNIVILKDAAASAIYGSKAANGVIIVETKMPQTGKLTLSYNANVGVSFADLSSYNLMNSSEKLHFEKLSGYYGVVRPDGTFENESSAGQYYTRKAEISRGVDTYWMSEPLRTAIKHTHNFNVEGGDSNFRYGVGFSYGSNAGVMKGSERETMNGNIKLLYRKNSIAISNNLNLDYNSSDREKVAFSRYSGANPFFRKRDADGIAMKVLEKYTNGDPSSSDYLKEVYVYNPLYDELLGSFDNTSNFGFTNNTEVDWSILQELKVKARFSISKDSGRSTKFISPDHTSFTEVDRLKKGSYQRGDNDNLSYDGDFNITYGKLVNDKHMINAVAGVRLNEKTNTSTGYLAEGFISDNFANPAFSTGYAEGKKPNYGESIRRSFSYYFNGGYSFDNRYMADVNIRSDGSSVFGSAKKFTTTWAVGLSWNLHREKFMENINWLSLLKLRASIGNPGNQNFDAYIAMKTYTYNNALQNHFGLSTIISSFGNSDLEWQKTIDKNIGIDIELFNRRLLLNFDTFSKVTDPLLIYLSLPTSTGTNQVPRNLGKQNGTGYTITGTYRIIYNENMTWSVNANARHVKSTYENIGNALDQYNRDNQSKNLIRYYDGANTTALWAVRSAGIDPATGREVFVKKDGTQTFVFDYNDEVVMGDSNPKLEGVIGTSLYYKGFSASVSFRYKFGGDVFMESLYNKVENISETSIKFNQDKRALTDRWQKPGDNAKFKSISSTESTPISSRFIETENVFSGESISVGYESHAKFLTQLGISSLTFRAYMNDIFRVSNIKNERGLDYPFERSFSFSLGIRF